MKAWIIDGKFGLDALKLVERETPKPKAGQVLIRVRAVSLNYRDIGFVEGKSNPQHPLPLIPASDGAGEVAAVGEGVTRVKLGDRVIPHFSRWLAGRPKYDERFDATPGGLYDLSLGKAPLQGVLSEYAVFDQERVVRIPDYLSFEEASTVPVAGLTAWSALFDATPLRPGGTVLVQGTGGVAVFAIQLARAAGARVIVTSSSDQKLVRARELGAHEGINYKTNPEWDKAALELTGGQGVDVVVDISGGELGRSLNALRSGGQVSVIGYLSGAQAQVGMGAMIAKAGRIQGISVGSRENLENLNQFLAQQRIHPVIDRTYPFEKAPEAIGELHKGNYVGKLVIQGAP